jgi:hypothetical protein
MLGISLWRSRWSLPTLAVFVAVFCAAFGWWRATQPTVITYDSSVYILQTSPLDTDVSLNLETTATVPIFASPAHASALRATLQCDEHGEPTSIRYHLPANWKMAFYANRLRPSH